MDDELPDSQNFPMSVLEMACGKGGDLRKWQEAKIQNYVGIDISNVSLQRAAARFMGFQGLSFCSLFIEGDGATDPQEFFKDFQDDMYFDIVSCQMALHYMLKSEENARNFLENVSQRLVDGGYFVATHPDANVIRKKLRELGSKDEHGRVFVKNDYYSLICNKKKFRKSEFFGGVYGFFLDCDLVGTKVPEGNTIKINYVNEYLIPMAKFQELALEYDLEMVESQNFHDFYVENIQSEDHFKFFRKMFNHKQFQNQNSY